MSFLPNNCVRAQCSRYRAQILLHEPHVHMSSPRDSSTHKLINAARGILELMYAISATSYDIALLDHLPIVRSHLTPLI